MVKCQSGFTIIEIALVMIIIGFLVGFGVTLIKPLTDRIKRNETKEIVLTAVETVVGYAAANGSRLPDGTLFLSLAKKQNDSWQNPIQYIWDTKLDINNLNSTICGKKTTDITLRRCTDAGCTAYTDIFNVAFIILSGGSNFNNQTAGNQGTSVATVIQTYDLELIVDNYAVDLGGIARPEGYDDLLEWVTVDELRTKLLCQGPPLTILNNELPPGDVGGAYTATLYAVGGVPFASGGGKYKWCLETVTGTPPSSLTFRDHNDANSIGFSTGCGSLAENSATWIQADFIVISGNPGASGSFFMTAFARDDNNSGNDAECNTLSNKDNCGSKSFVITVNP